VETNNVLKVKYDEAKIGQQNAAMDNILRSPPAVLISYCKQQEANTWNDRKMTGKLLSATINHATNLMLP